MFTLAQRGHDRKPFNLEAERAAHPDITEEDFWGIAEAVWDYTELSVAVMYNLYSAIRYIVDAGIKGDFVECGVNLGGSIMLMEHVLLKYDTASQRRLFALDTFTGFVRRTDDLDIDISTGAAACVPEEEVIDTSSHAIENMRSVGFGRLEVVKGDVLETIPTLDVKNIALLRLDTDTYDTTKFELENLYDKVAKGGVVIVDDYGYTYGCKKAVDDFIAGRKIFVQRANRLCRSWVKVF
jgi:O-methyltransferase